MNWLDATPAHPILHQSARPTETTEPSLSPAQGHRRLVVPALGITQILAWGSTFYLLAVLAAPIVKDAGWSYDWVVAGLSLGLAVAGLVSPRVGRAIKVSGGRPVLASGAAIIALGLLLIGSSQNLVWYLGGWLVLGAGMGSGLYDAAFSTLGTIYGRDSRNPISQVTLYGGFASTVCWPLSSLLVEHLGWRGACFVYAAIQAGLSLPTYLMVLPRAAPVAGTQAEGSPRTAMRLARDEVPSFVVLAAIVTIAAAILAMMGTHLLALLQAKGMTLSTAVTLGMLIGPSAVGARMIETTLGRYYHPIWTMTASALLTAAGALLLLGYFPFAALAIILYASGNGIGSIARGTLPLALFGAARYPVLMGRLALPLLIAMSIAPYIGALALEAGGPNSTIAIIAALAVTNVLLIALLWRTTWGLQAGKHEA
jgi:MFS family permease